MEGPIATWYAKNTGRDLTRFRRMAATIAALAPAGSRILEVAPAAFKNFTDPVGALNECERVLAPHGRALIYDLRKDASIEEIAEEVRGMDLSRFNAWMTNWTFRTVLLRRAYTRGVLEGMVARSRFGRGDIRLDGIAFELRLSKPPAVGTFLRSAASA